nr:hypothetical protein [Tanacetum cinerariifolium]
MVAILEKGEFNTEFHPMVDFISAYPLRYALTVKPTIFVSHIRQFWSAARIKTTDEGTYILATVDGIQRTIFESFLRRNLKLRDEEGIVSIPDTKLFENLTLMGYNISQNQKLTFQKGQFFHQWKYLIHTIMQCLSPKSTGLNEFSSNIATALVCLATNRAYNFSKMVFDGMVKNVNNKISKFLMYLRFLTLCLRMSQFGQITHTHQYVVPFHTKKLFTTLWVNSPSFSGRIVPFFNTMLVHQGEGSGIPTELHHTPSPEADTSYPTTSSFPLPSIPTAPIPHVTQPDTTPIRQYSRRARIAQSSALPIVADEPASPVRDVSEEEACPTESGFIADQDRATIAKSSILPHNSTPRVTSPAADEGSMQHTIYELTALCTSLQRQHSELLAKFQAQEMEILRKGKEVMVESDIPKKQRLQEQIDAQVSRELEEKQEKEDMRMNEQITRDAEVARIHAEEELQELISDLVKYQANYSKVYKLQSQQRRPMTKKQKSEYYMAMIRNNLGWKVKDFKGLSFEEIEAKFAKVWKQVKDFIPMGSKEEAKRLKRKGLNLEQEHVKKQKSSEEASKMEKSTEEITEEKMKEMMQLVHVEDVYVQALQVKHPIINWNVHTEGQRTYWKIIRVHHLTAKDKEIFMLVEKDYPLRKRLALVMISYKLQVENYSQMAEDLIRKIYNIANTPRQQGD